MLRRSVCDPVLSFLIDSAVRGGVLSDCADNVVTSGSMIPFVPAVSLLEPTLLVPVLVYLLVVFRFPV